MVGVVAAVAVAELVAGTFGRCFDVIGDGASESETIVDADRVSTCYRTVRIRILARRPPPEKP